VQCLTLRNLYQANVTVVALQILLNDTNKLNHCQEMGAKPGRRFLIQPAAKLEFVIVAYVIYIFNFLYPIIILLFLILVFFYLNLFLVFRFHYSHRFSFRMLHVSARVKIKQTSSPIRPDIRIFCIRIEYRLPINRIQISLFQMR